MSKKICGRCGKEYTEPPAVSRADNKTLICPMCRTTEALEVSGVDENTKAEILKKIYNSGGTDNAR